FGSSSAFAAFDSGCTPGCTVTTCSCTRREPYWTSSTYRGFRFYAWSVDFANGTVDGHDKTAKRLVRAVRGGR
ncbi:MAG: hypothetical protein ACKO2K_19205, partial [Alphaproteobacteria bacterium]